MTIYIVWYTNFDGNKIFESAHSSPQLAQERVNKFSKTDRDCFEIEPYQLDCENY